MDVIAAEPSSSFVASNHDFALSLLRRAPTIQPMVFSPLSVALTLSVLFIGAKDEKRREIGNALLNAGNTTSPKEFDRLLHIKGDDLAFSNFGPQVTALKKLLAPEKLSYDAGTRLYVSNGTVLSRSHFLDSIQERLNVSTDKLQFSDLKKTVETINEFGNRTTKGAITELINESDVKNVTTVLISLATFNADWGHVFLPEDTQDRIFHSDAKTTRIVPMMANWQGSFPYAENGRLRIVKLDYWGDDRFNFVLMLPKARFGLAEIRKTLSGTEIEKLLVTAEHHDVELFLPKFKIETAWDATSLLEKLCRKNVFKKTEKLSVSIPHQLTVSKIFHSAALNVYEAGTRNQEILVKLAGWYPPLETIIFHADEPFLFAITFDDQPLFYGQYS